ncbi:MAG: nicotinate-nucleotide adenylyltransferase [Acidobacteriota bacterium]
MRIGLLGGTFDPVHCGHLDVAHAARLALSLDVVWLVPARIPPHRTRPYASPAHRFAMVAEAVADQEGLLASDVEMQTEGPSYTFATLDRLAAQGVSGESLFLILGADAFSDLPTWKAYPEILDRCHFVVLSRPGIPARAVRAAVPALADRMRDTPCEVPRAPSIFLVDAPTTAVSSTGVREAVIAGDGLEGLVPAPVARHIGKYGLYGRSSSEVSTSNQATTRSVG